MKIKKIHPQKPILSPETERGLPNTFPQPAKLELQNDGTCFNLHAKVYIWVHLFGGTLFVGWKEKHRP